MRSGHRRNRAGITQAELAARIGHRTAGAVSQWERGLHRVDVRSLTAIAAALGIDPLDLLTPETPVTLRLLRARAGLNQEQVAKAAGISPSSWARIEAGRRQIWPDELDGASRALGVPAGRVLAAVSAVPDSTPIVADLPKPVLERLMAHRRAGESLAEVLDRLVPPPDPAP